MTAGTDSVEGRRRRAGRGMVAPRVRWTFVVFGILVGALLGIAIPQVLDSRSAIEDLRSQWQPAGSAASSLAVGFANQESGVRGYVTTGDTAFLAQYREATPRITKQLEALRSRLHDDARGRKLLDTVEQRYQRWRDEVAGMEIALVAGNRRDEAQAALAGGAVGRSSTQLRAAQSVLLEYTERRSRGVAAAVRRADDRMLLTLGATAGAILAILLAARSVFGRWAARLDRQHETESKLAEQTELLLRVTNTSPDPIFLKDDDHRYVFVNDGAMRALGGTSPEGWVGRRDEEFLGRDELATIRRHDAEARASDDPLVFEERVRGRYYETTRAAFRFVDGRVGVLGVARDVTARALERARLSAVAAVTRAVAMHESVDAVAAAARDALTEATGADVVWILIADRDRDGLRAVLSGGTHRSTDQAWRFVPGDLTTFTSEAYRTGQPRIVHLEEVDRDSASYGIFENEDVATVAFVPFPGGPSPAGVVDIGWREHLPVTTEELSFYQSLVAILAEGVARARSTELERLAVHAFQQSLLPRDFPKGVQVAARYDPALALEVGGDWYDVFSLPDGRIGLAVGDVIGHGVDAAAQMAQLRSLLRAAAVRSDDPGAVLDDLDRFASEDTAPLAATVCYAALDLERRELRYSCAGHPPPLLSNGSIEYLDAARSGPVGFGLAAEEPRPSASLQVDHEAVLVMYTDGLVEQRGHSIDDGLDALARSVAAAVAAPVEDLADAILHDLAQAERRDDAALLCVRLPGVPSRYFQEQIPADAALLRHLRKDLRAWLEDHAVATSIVDDVVSATAEALSNSIDHAYHNDRVGRIAVDASIDGSVRVAVRDGGHWSQPMRRPDRGRGFIIMEALMDEVQVEARGAGTTVRLVKRIGEESAGV